MKRFFWLLFWLWVCAVLVQDQALGQRQITFLPQATDPRQPPTYRLTSILRPQGSNQPGHVLADLIEEGQYTLILPGGKWQLHLRPCPLKQYRQIFTGRQWTSSQVELWEGKSSDPAPAQVVIVTQEGIVRHLILQQAGILTRIDPGWTEPFGLSTPSRESYTLAGSCPTALATHPPPATAAARLDAENTCQVVDLALVTDLGVNGPADKIGEIEAQLLAEVTSASMYFSSFDTQLRLQVRSMSIPITESPFPTNLQSPFSDINQYMQQWMADQSFPTSDFDVTVGITKYNYETGSLIGHMFPNPASMGSIIVERQPANPNLNVLLLTHELGHAFGASHDAQDYTFIMSPTISSGTWSEKSKTDINAYLVRDEVRQHLRKCPYLRFEGQVVENTVQLTWSSSYEQEVDSYQLTYQPPGSVSTLSLGSIKATGSSDLPGQYRWVHQAPLAGRNIYRLEQISRWGTLLESLSIGVAFPIAEPAAPVLAPNPFSNRLQLEKLDRGTEITIYNAIGQLMLQNIPASSSWTVDTADWSAGLYSVKINQTVLRIVKL